MKQTIVISAFPACGKTYAFEILKDKFSILDSDSSKFSWTQDENGNKVRNTDFPNNYIAYIKDKLGKVDFIFVSSHLAVREALTEAGIEFVTIYPCASALKEWIGRFYLRGSSNDFIRFQVDHWYEFMRNIEKEPHGKDLIRFRNNDHIDENLLNDIKRFYDC